MKKLAELQIGNKIVRSDMYEAFGSPTLFVCYKEDNRIRRYYKTGYFQARCITCGASFTFNTGSVGFYGDSCTCPACGRTHTGNAVMYADNEDSLLPDITIMKVMDFKEKVELRIKYTAVSIGKFVHKTYRYLTDVQERFIFDVKNSTCRWKKTLDGKMLEDMQIGYISDFWKLKEKTALWFYGFSHKINKGNSFTDLLQALRSAVNKKIKECGKTPKRLYIGGIYEYKLYGNILNLAHRVRFWDMDNIQMLAQGAGSMNSWEKNVLCTSYLPERFDERIYKEMQKTDYITAVCKVLNLPNIQHVRRYLQYENLAMLRECYKIKNYDVAQAMFGYAKRGISALEEIDKMVEFYNMFITYYPKMQMQYVVKKWDEEYHDILRLWQSADKVTKNNFRKEVPALAKLHTWLSLAVAKQADREIIFDVPEEVVNRYTMLMKAFGAKCIEKNSELKFWALSLKNCAAGYKSMIGCKKQLVGISDDRGKPVALLEINQNYIRQAKLFDNDPVCYRKEVNDTVLEFASKCGLKIGTSDVLEPTAENYVNMEGIA